MQIPLSAAVFTAVAALAPAAGAQVDFDAHWHDGRAEIDGYRLSIVRYGQQRTGQAVMIFVTEPFSDSKRVKAEGPSPDPADTLDVLKLNLVRDFQTGIYDYNTMTSVFSRTDDFEPVKVSFSSAEWCGHVYEELLVEPDGISATLSSYFEDESSSEALPAPAHGVLEDNLFILLRGLRGPYLEPGESRQAPLLPGSLQRRLRHRAIDWTTATIERLAEPERIGVPAGEFSTIVYVVTTADMRQGRFYIEEAPPHRIIKWQWAADRPTLRPPEAAETGELTGTLRVQYWKLNANGQERYLEDLGLR